MIPVRYPQACSPLFTLLRQQQQHRSQPRPNHYFSFSSVSVLFKRQDQLPPRPTVERAETHKRYLKGSGPGGQKINKTNSAVQLTHIATGLVVKSQATRSRTQNETIARRIMAEKLELIEKGDQSRAALKGARMAKKKASADKKKRRKYKRLAEEKEGTGEDIEEMAEMIKRDSTYVLDTEVKT